MTALEDTVDKNAPPEELRKVDADVKIRLEEITALIVRLRAEEVVQEPQV